MFIIYLLLQQQQHSMMRSTMMIKRRQPMTMSSIAHSGNDDELELDDYNAYTHENFCLPKLLNEK